MKTRIEEMMMNINLVLGDVEEQIMNLETGKYENEDLRDEIRTMTDGQLIVLRKLGLITEEQEVQERKRIQPEAATTRKPLTQKQLIDYCNLHQPRWLCGSCHFLGAECKVFREKYGMIPMDEESLHPDRYTDEVLGDGEE